MVIKEELTFLSTVGNLILLDTGLINILGLLIPVVFWQNALGKTCLDVVELQVAEFSWKRNIQTVINEMHGPIRKHN